MSTTGPGALAPPVGLDHLLCTVGERSLAKSPAFANDEAPCRVGHTPASSRSNHPRRRVDTKKSRKSCQACSATVDFCLDRAAMEESIRDGGRKRGNPVTDWGGASDYAISVRRPHTAAMRPTAASTTRLAAGFIVIWNTSPASRRCESATTSARDVPSVVSEDRLAARRCACRSRHASSWLRAVLPLAMANVGKYDSVWAERQR